MNVWIIWCGLPGDNEYHIHEIYKDKDKAEEAAAFYNLDQHEDDGLVFHYYVSWKDYEVK